MPLRLDLAGDLDVANGRIQTPDPMHIFFEDVKFEYNGEHYERGMWMDYFATSVQSSTGSDAVYKPTRDLRFIDR